MRLARTSEDVLAEVCDELVVSCELERVLLSRVEDGAWQPWVVNGVVRDEQWFAEWAERSIPLGELVLEAELLAAPRPLLVEDVDDPRVHPIIRAGQATTYLVAPLVATGEVFGFLHADHGVGGAPCSPVDREVLWTFAQGFAHLYERLTLLERLPRQRQRVSETLFLVDVALSRHQQGELALLARDVDEPAATGPAAHERLASLTAREREVLEVLASGASNAEIARRMVVSVATVKTHVKHVLAKLGVQNRSQAIGVLLDSRT